MPKVWDSTTSSVIKEDIDKSSEVFKDHSIQLTTTIPTLLKTSTHSNDYDYYNNELEEADHKN